MKKILFTMFVVGTFLSAGMAHAGAYGNYVPFHSYSTAGTTYSSAVNVRGFTHKQMQLDLATGTAVGTLTIQCGPTSSGPWVTCASSAGTAITSTTSKVMTWEDATAYIRAGWAKTSGVVNAWLNWQE